MLLLMLALAIDTADPGPRCLAIANHIDEAAFVAQGELDTQASVVSGMRRQVELLADVRRNQRRIAAAAPLARKIRGRFPTVVAGAAPDLAGKPFDDWHNAGRKCARG